MKEAERDSGITCAVALALNLKTIGEIVSQRGGRPVYIILKNAIAAHFLRCFVLA